MFQDLEQPNETIKWFQNQNLETKIRWIELWDEAETDKLEERLGDNYDSFREIMESVQKAKSETEARNAVIDELKSKEFELPVAVSLYEATESAGFRQDAEFLRRTSSGPNQLKQTAKVSIRKYIGNPTIYPDAESSQELVEKYDNLLTNAIAPALAKNYEAINQVGDIFSDQCGYTREQTQSVLEPLEPYVTDILLTYVATRVISIEDTLEEVEAQQNELGRGLKAVADQTQSIIQHLSQQHRTQDDSDDYEDFDI